jgi:hypothetical protein
MERQYPRAAPSGPPRPAPPARRPGRQAEAAEHDALLIGAGLAWLAVAASSGLLLAQAARLQREMGAR